MSLQGPYSESLQRVMDVISLETLETMYAEYVDWVRDISKSVPSELSHDEFRETCVTQVQILETLWRKRAEQ